MMCKYYNRELVLWSVECEEYAKPASVLYRTRVTSMSSSITYIQYTLCSYQATVWGKGYKT